MIEKNTVLVLGAGASVDYGYPTGRKLLDNIIDKIDIDKGPRFYNDLIRFFGIKDRETILEFHEALSLAGKPSIDAFLEHRPIYIEIGKLLIALELIACEDNLLLLKPKNKNASWYESLYNKMNAPKKSFSDNRLSMITFNYDRSLEHYLFTAIKNTYGIIDDKECAEIVRSIPILHIYGRLDELPWENERGRLYGKKATPDQIKKACDSISILSEDKERSMTFAHAFSLLENAQVVYFLGFGYHEMNLKRLNLGKLKKYINKNLPDAPQDLFKRIISGTTLGLGKSKIKSIPIDWPCMELPLEEVDIIKFLKDYAPINW